VVPLHLQSSRPGVIARPVSLIPLRSRSHSRSSQVCGPSTRKQPRGSSLDILLFTSPPPVDKPAEGAGAAGPCG
jgi:hypothetical protein